MQRSKPNSLPVVLRRPRRCRIGLPLARLIAEPGQYRCDDLPLLGYLAGRPAGGFTQRNVSSSSRKHPLGSNSAGSHHREVRVWHVLVVTFAVVASVPSHSFDMSRNPLRLGSLRYTALGVPAATSVPSQIGSSCGMDTAGCLVSLDEPPGAGLRGFRR